MARRAVHVEHRPAADDRPPLELRRSTARRRTVSAYARDGRIVVLLPAGLPPEEEERLIATLVGKVQRRMHVGQLGGDEELERRAARLADRYLDGVRPTSIRWSTRQERRRGSCIPAEGRIWISSRLAAYPAYVLDAVIVHELAHLTVHHHGPEFWALARRYPHTERARGFLEGVEFEAIAPSLPPPASP